MRTLGQASLTCKTLSRKLFCEGVQALFLLCVCVRNYSAQHLKPAAPGQLFSTHMVADQAPAAAVPMGNPGPLPQDMLPPGHTHKINPQDRLACDGVYQDYCAKPGQAYPRGDILYYIEENKAMMKRMFGSVSAKTLMRKEEEDQAVLDNADLRKKRTVTKPQQLFSKTAKSLPASFLVKFSLLDKDAFVQAGVTNRAVFDRNMEIHETLIFKPADFAIKRWYEPYFMRPVQLYRRKLLPPHDGLPSRTGEGALQELVTPFWAVNGTGVKLAIVNSAPFEQAIHTVKCARTMQQNQRCHPARPCWCNQEYSWFRLLAYDPNDNCKGIFMDWFKFPSHCACKCVAATAVLGAPAATGSATQAPPS